jgi:glucans biosynthesis protein
MATCRLGAALARDPALDYQRAGRKRGKGSVMVDECLRRRAALLGILVTLLLAAAGEARAFGLDDVAAIAERNGAEPYRADRQKAVPEWMRAGKMTYDQWRDIRFKPDHALWRDEGLPFQVQLFHPGLYFERSIEVNVVDADGVKPFPYSTALFDYGKNKFASKIPSDIGFAGLRIHYPLKSKDYHDEVAVFLGASYFRAVGRDNVWGLSARGLAIDTVEASGEEFPNFIEYWLAKPTQGATHFVLYALLDGPTATGAYRFDITPGAETAMAVDCVLFARGTRPAKIGLAPLTSMFFFGENTTRKFEDFRPEVHDSDGLLLHFAGGEWLWRPLDNPPRINVASFAMHDPRGYGLIQRDRDFGHHQDIETRAERRPSAWVEPRGDWGDGHVQLVEIPTGNEKLDNMVAYWVPATPPKPGAPLRFGYTLRWFVDAPERPPGARVVATRRDRGTIDTSNDGYRYVVDFEGDALRALDDASPPRAVVTATNGAKVYDEHVYKNPVTGGFRLTFQIKPKDEQPVELRAYLERNGDVLSETWSYVWLG